MQYFYTNVFNFYAIERYFIPNVWRGMNGRPRWYGKTITSVLGHELRALSYGYRTRKTWTAYPNSQQLFIPFQMDTLHRASGWIDHVLK